MLNDARLLDGGERGLGTRLCQQLKGPSRYASKRTGEITSLELCLPTSGNFSVR